MGGHSGTGSPRLIYGERSPMAEVERRCRRLGASHATLLISGETGTGKEVLARLAHASSPRATGPFVPVNCGAIPELLMESELFGYVRGAFTGALTSRQGRVALASGGTLFLDEIGELPLAMQVKLLRLIQERTYEPVGGEHTVSADFRLITATHRDLAAEVAAGRFRQDLYYRLMVCPIEVPPLRARAEDAAVLFQHFWRLRGETRPLDDGALRALQRFPWPGNVRELQNVVERVSLCCEREVIGEQDLPLSSIAAGLLDERGLSAPTAPTAPPQAPVAEARVTALPARSNGSAPPSLPIDLPALLQDLEDRYIERALGQAAGNKKLAAELLGLQRTTLVEKLRRKAKLAPAT